MLIAIQKRKENIIEYLLYMWQLEDLVRANDLSIKAIDRQIVQRYDQPESVKEEILQWYDSLIEMMYREEKTQSGHLQINQNVVIELTDLHLTLLRISSSKFQNYALVYYQALPDIVAFRAKSGKDRLPEIESCFNALYGILLLKVQGKKLSKETLESLQRITRFLTELGKMYHKEKAGLLEFD